MIAQKQANKKSLIKIKKDTVTSKINIRNKIYGVFFCIEETCVKGIEYSNLAGKTGNSDVIIHISSIIPMELA